MSEPRQFYDLETLVLVEGFSGERRFNGDAQEDLYQAFKERLMSELVAEGRSTEGVVFAKLKERYE